MRVRGCSPWLASWLALTCVAACRCDDETSVALRESAPTVDPTPRPRPPPPPPAVTVPAPVDDPHEGSEPPAQDASASDAASARDAAGVETPGDAATSTRWQPADPPTGSIPDCRAPPRPQIPARDARWIAYRAQPAPETFVTTYFLRISADGVAAPKTVDAVQMESPLGSWSSDGQYYALPLTQQTGVSRALQLLTVRGEELTLSMPITGRMLGFAPTRHTLVISELSLFKLYDAERLADAPRKVPAPYGPVENTFWSLDGRYLGLTMPEAAQPGLRRLDLDSEQLALEPPFASSGSNPRWSPDARYLAFNRYLNNITELWLADWTDGTARLRRVASGVSSSSSFGGHLWLDATHLLWEQLDRQVHLVSLQGDTLSDTVLFDLGTTGWFQASPGGACVAFTGDCAVAADPGVCVVNTSQPALRATVSKLAFPTMMWHDTGGLLANQYGDRIEVVNLDGAAFAPLLVTSGDEIDSVEERAWAPGAARWFAYVASPARAQPRLLHLWNATTKETLRIEPEGLHPFDFKWSPDARYLAIMTSDHGSPPARAPLLVQRIDGDELGPLWTSNGPLLSASGSSSSDLVFQP